MTTIPIYLEAGSVPGDVPQASSGCRAATKLYKKRPLKQLSVRSETLAAA